MNLGAQYLGDDRCAFRVWAPARQQVAVKVLSPNPRTIPMEQDPTGYWHVVAHNIPPGTRYLYELDGEDERPDPASQRQPEGVHGPSEVVDQRFDWAETEGEWRNLPLDEYIFYELHVGTFTPQGTFRALIDRLPDLAELGVTAIEIMPVAQFPGDQPTGEQADNVPPYRSWGYDGTYPFAVQCSYGTPAELKEFVQACHQHGLAAVLDVVHNHFGPEGNYTGFFGPYQTDVYHTPWGTAINFDQAQSDHIRTFFIESACYWLREFHFDALRLDAVHAIYDSGAKHFLQELREAVDVLAAERGQPLYLVAESDLNDPRLIRPPEQGGFGLDAQWSDDFHHALHALLTGERSAYYADFGRATDLAEAIAKTFVYDWRYSAFRERKHGAPALDRPPRQFVICSQNHDQVGNRMLGERLSHLVSFGGQKLAAAAVLLSPYLPLLFMGEEYGEEAPFLYFASHGDAHLVEAVREGRKREFAEFHAEGEPYDAEAPATFLRSKLNWSLREQGDHAVLLRFYQRLIELHKHLPALQSRDQRNLEAGALDTERIVWWRRRANGQTALGLFNFNEAAVEFAPPTANRTWHKVIDSADPAWRGGGVTLPDSLAPDQTVQIPGESCALYVDTQP